MKAMGFTPDKLIFPELATDISSDDDRVGFISEWMRNIVLEKIAKKEANEIEFESKIGRVITQLTKNDIDTYSFRLLDHMFSKSSWDVMLPPKAE
jgi:hypothetical protein